MLNSYQQTQPTSFPTVFFSSVERHNSYEAHRHRVYSVAFWMTGNELAAEQLMTDTFRAVFAETNAPTSEEVDQALVCELSKSLELPLFTLKCAPVTEVRKVRRNVLRTDLEQAVLHLPATEKLIFLFHDLERYNHHHIARLMGITERESQLGLHQARLRLREILSR